MIIFILTCFYKIYLYIEIINYSIMNMRYLLDSRLLKYIIFEINNLYSDYYVSILCFFIIIISVIVIIIIIKMFKVFNLKYFI